MWEIEDRFRVKLGGNYYINTPDLVVVRGESLFRVYRREDGLLGIDFDVYDSRGSKVATVRRGNIVQGNSSDYLIQKERHRYWLTSRASGKTLCDVRKVAKAEPGTELEVTVHLYTKSGFLLDARPEGTNLTEGISIRGCVMEDCSAGLVVD